MTQNPCLNTLFPLSVLLWLYSMQVVHHCLIHSMPSVSTKRFYCSQTMTLHCASGNSAPCTDRWVCSLPETNEISLILKHTLWSSVFRHTLSCPSLCSQFLTTLNAWDISKLFSLRSAKKNLNEWIKICWDLMCSLLIGCSFYGTALD